jgi:SAM-dependent methyltransferase
MTTTTSTTAETYTLDNGWEQARRRLRLLEQCYDASTTRRLAAIGVSSGWRCLELGAGGGSVAAFLARQVGPQGTVTAVDIDTRFVAEIQAENLEVVETDVAAAGLPRDTFDLVHCRALLMHLSARDQVLESMVGSLRPGGWILIEEADSSPFAAVQPGVLKQVIVDGLTSAGVDWTYARTVPALLQGHGLCDVAAESEVQFFEGGSGIAELARLSVWQAWEAGFRGGATREHLEAWDTLVRRPGQWFQGWGLVSAWGRRPAR